MEAPLYDCNGVRIETHPPSRQDHILYLGRNAGEESIYFMQRGILKELALKEDSLDSLISLARMYREFDSVLESEGIHPIDVSTAIREAYAEEERRYEESRRQ